MSFTYTGDLTDPVQYVRFKITDTVEEAANYMDEEINYFVNKYDSPQTEDDLNKVSAVLLKNWIKKLLSQPSRERSGAYESYSSTAESLKALLNEVEAEIASASPPTVYVGGVYRQDVRANRCNEDLVQPHFEQHHFFRGDVEEDGRLDSITIYRD